MKKLVRISAVVIAATLCSTSVFGQSGRFGQFGGSTNIPTLGGPGGISVPKHAPDHIVVRFKEGVSYQVKLAILKKYRLTLNEAASSKYFAVLNLSPDDLKRGASPFSVSKTISKEPIVRWAEIDPVLTPDFVPSDSMFGDMWHLHNDGINGALADADVDAPEAWDSAGSFPDVVVAVCDDGFDLDHEDLLDNVYVNPNEIPGNSVDDDGNGFVDDVTGWDFSSDDNDPRPQNGDSHGTHVVGTVAATWDNGVGVTGVGDNNIKYMPLRMYGGPNGFMSSLANAVDYAWENGAQVISVSYNIDGFTQALSDAIGRAKQADVVYCNSAGNNGQQNPPRQQLRALHNNIIFVVATTSSDTKASFSNWGTLCEVGAPGVDILSTLPGNSYGLSSGTSMATPLFAGIMGMVRSANPSLSAREALDLAISKADSVATLSTFIASGKRTNFAQSVVGTTPVPFSISTSMGSLVSGDLTSVLTGDDGDAYTIASAMLDKRGFYAAMDIDITSGLTPDQVNGIKVSMTTKGSVEGPTQFLYLYNYTTQKWDVFRNQRLKTFYTEIAIDVQGDLSKYVDPGTGSVKARIMAYHQIRRNGATPLPFELMVDLVDVALYQ